jgi:hypothetical protein
MPYEKLYGKKPSLANLRVYGCRAYVRQHKIPRSKKLDPQAWIGYLIRYTASNVWKIWNPLTRKITDERDVIFDEDIIFNPDKLFHAEAIKILDLPEPLIEINATNEYIQIRQVAELESSDDDELDEVEAQGVNVPINVISKGAIPEKESSQIAESLAVNLIPPTPLATPGRPIQHDAPIESIKQDDGP